MSKKPAAASRGPSIMVLGVGAFAQSTAQILKDGGARVSTYLTRNYGHYPPSLVGPTYNSARFPDPTALIKEHKIDLVAPMSIDWAQAAWSKALLSSGVPIFCPTGE